MQEMMITCPCCGRPIVFHPIDGSVTAGAAEFDMAQLASELGIELGTLKGGEEIGD